MSPASQSVTFHHTHKLKGQMGELLEQLRAEMDYVTEPRARAMLETTAEVLTGLVKAFDDYEQNKEESWQAGARACEDSEL